ncbi:MAG: hypothetical protein NT025_10295 [bacterium]|nr:hypothetical protein [bacterium]
MSAAAKDSLSPAKFLEAVRKGRRFAMVLLRGEEEYLLREALQEFVSKTVPPESADFNYSELRAGEVTCGGPLPLPRWSWCPARAAKWTGASSGRNHWWKWSSGR